MRRRPDWDENIDRTFYMPTSSDLAVRAFRKWYKTIAGGEPDWAVSARGRKSTRARLSLDGFLHVEGEQYRS